MTGNTQHLIASVLTTKASHGEEPDYAILDAGVNVAEYVRYEYHDIAPVTQALAKRTHRYRIAGPICQPGDVLYASVQLPEMQPGARVVIYDSGAYFVAASNQFSFPRPGVAAIDADGNAKLWRRAELFEDIVDRHRQR